VRDVLTAKIFYHLSPWLEVEKAVQICRESDRSLLRLVAISEELRHSRTLSRAQESGRNRFQLFADEMKESVAEKLTLESSLPAALEKQQLYLEYQPEIDIASGAVIAAEARLRWRHPDLGLVPPDKFIPVAEYRSR
jgi:predicted signal transduction protein with EAL and GGDEF domain